MSVNWSSYSLQELKQHITHTFRSGGGSRPDVLLIEIDGQQAVLKDQAGADRFFSLLIGPILSWRESKALKKLDALSCIPTLLAQPTARSFLMTYHPSEPITRLRKIDPDWAIFFDRLSASIDAMHRAGVAHNDLRNPTNTLITADGEPIMVDLVAAFLRGHKWNLPNQWIFNKFCQVDQSAMTKMKALVAPTLVKDEDIVAEEIAGRFGMAIRSLGQWIRKLSRRLFTD